MNSSIKFNNTNNKSNNNKSNNNNNNNKSNKSNNKQNSNYLNKREKELRAELIAQKMETETKVPVQKVDFDLKAKERELREQLLATKNNKIINTNNTNININNNTSTSKSIKSIQSTIPSPSFETNIQSTLSTTSTPVSSNSCIIQDVGSSGVLSVSGETQCTGVVTSEKPISKKQQKNLNFHLKMKEQKLARLNKKQQKILVDTVQQENLVEPLKNLIPQLSTEQDQERNLTEVDSNTGDNNSSENSIEPNTKTDEMLIPIISTQPLIQSEDLVPKSESSTKEKEEEKKEEKEEDFNIGTLVINCITVDPIVLESNCISSFDSELVSETIDKFDCHETVHSIYTLKIWWLILLVCFLSSLFCLSMQAFFKLPTLYLPFSEPQYQFTYISLEPVVQYELAPPPKVLLLPCPLPIVSTSKTCQNCLVNYHIQETMFDLPVEKHDEITITEPEELPPDEPKASDINTQVVVHGTVNLSLFQFIFSFYFYFENLFRNRFWF
ncbi:putative homeobox transcription factor [Tieghemostelium lacteum]|uniref:Putative homeobox transcription factor n=1 Tax=Tieghemostelium lacteum TaxID=361077 RepID=A0A151Z4K1_TIELA|nr:putative homeobox transcription factor [Tieghemostelium lacteum]|eukprot:KYQ88871.1 putative homeobox transcription factor [Tieghemostelium lacteum]